LLRIVFPPAHKALKRFYDGYTGQSEYDQKDTSLKIFFCFFFGLVFLLSGRAANEQGIRTKLVDTLNTQLHVREATGKNDGVEVEKYLRFVGAQRGDAWCAAFVSWNLNAVGVSAPPNPKSAWSPNFANKKFIVWSAKLVKEHKAKKPQPGDCFTLFYPNLNRVGHVGFIIAETDNYFITIEGNTGLSGTREGSGNHKYKRSKSKIYAITNYITPYANEKKLTSHIDTIDNNGFVQAKTNNQVGNYYFSYLRQLNQFDYRKGYSNLEGYNNPSERRQYRSSYSFNSRHSWQHKTSRYKEQLKRFNYEYLDSEWPVDGKIQMSGLGIETAIARTLHTAITKGEFLKTEGFNKNSKQGSKGQSTLYSFVDINC
jgi:hypothetical protein